MAVNLSKALALSAVIACDRTTASLGVLLRRTPAVYFALLMILQLFGCGVWLLGDQTAPQFSRGFVGYVRQFHTSLSCLWGVYCRRSCRCDRWRAKGFTDLRQDEGICCHVAPKSFLSHADYILVTSPPINHFLQNRCQHQPSHSTMSNPTTRCY